MFQKIKKFLSRIFKKENVEKGAIASGTIIGIIIIGTLLLAAVASDDDAFGLTEGIGSWTVGHLMAVMFFFSKLVFTIGSNIFEGIYSMEILQQPMTRGALPIASTVIHGWSIVRDFANMFIVLGFVVIGIATILRMREYEAQKKLLPLIIVALLINFSLLICGIVIDATNITMRYFTQISEPTTIMEPYKNLVVSDDAIKSIKASIVAAGEDETKKIEAQVVGYGGASILLVVAAMILFVYGILLLFRHVALMLLVILSPLAFVCSVFPATRQIYDKWKTQFFQWAIIGIPTAFFIYLAGHLLLYFSSTPIGVGIPGTDAAGASLAFWIPTAFLLFAYSLVFQTSAIGASAALGLATGAMGFAVGASKWTGKKLGGAAAKTTGLERAGTATKDWATQRLESLNLMKSGTTADNKQKRLNESMSGFKKQYGDNPDDNKKLAEKLTSRMTSGKDKAAIATILAERKALDYIPKDRQEAEAANAFAFGVSKETFLKDRPDLMTGVANKDAKQKLISEERSRLEQTGATPEQIKQQISGYKPSAVAIENKKREMAKEKEQERKLGYVSATDADVVNRAKEDYVPTNTEISATKTELDTKKPLGAPATTDADAIEYLRRYYRPNTTALIRANKNLGISRAKEKTYGFKYADRGEAQRDLIDEKAKELRGLGISGVDLDDGIKAYGDSLTPTDINTGLENLNNKREKKAISKLGISKLRELPESQIDINLAEHSNYGTLERAWLEFTKESKDKYKTLAPDLENKVRSELGLSSTADKTQIKDAIRALKSSNVRADREKAKSVKDIINKINLIKE
jgi:hypothetical protein